MARNACVCGATGTSGTCEPQAARANVTVTGTDASGFLVPYDIVYDLLILILGI